MVSKAAGPVAMSNRFKALAGNECVEEGFRAPTRTVNILEFAKPAVRQGIIKHSKRYCGMANKNRKSVGFSDKLTEGISAPENQLTHGAKALAEGQKRREADVCNDDAVTERTWSLSRPLCPDWRS